MELRLNCALHDESYPHIAKRNSNDAYCIIRITEINHKEIDYVGFKIGGLIINKRNYSYLIGLDTHRMLYRFTKNAVNPSVDTRRLPSCGQRFLQPA